MILEMKLPPGAPIGRFRAKNEPSEVANGKKQKYDEHYQEGRLSAPSCVFGTKLN